MHTMNLSNKLVAIAVALAVFVNATGASATSATFQLSTVVEDQALAGNWPSAVPMHQMPAKVAEDSALMPVPVLDTERRGHD